MRVLIMCDMEGVSGIVAWQQVDGGAEMYEEGRRLYTEEVNAAVRGAKAAGADEIVVVDCHGAGPKGGWNFNSLIPEALHPDCEWVAGHTWGRYTEMWGKRLPRLPADRNACPKRNARRRLEPHHLHCPLPQPMVQR